MFKLAVKVLKDRIIDYILTTSFYLECLYQIVLNIFDRVVMQKQNVVFLMKKEWNLESKKRLRSLNSFQEEVELAGIACFLEPRIFSFQQLAVCLKNSNSNYNK